MLIRKVSFFHQGSDQIIFEGSHFEIAFYIGFCWNVWEV